MTSLANVKKLQRDIINTLTNPEAAYYSLKIVSISIIQQLCQIWIKYVQTNSIALH